MHLSRKLAGITALMASSTGFAWAAAAQPPVFLEPGKTTTDYRNVALNPTAAPGSDVASFPHATSNSEYNQAEFAARCAIDGNRRNDDVHGHGSWGPQKDPGIWWRLDFGHAVAIDKLVLYLRAAWSPAPEPHDSYWKAAVVEFSDGSKIKLSLAQKATGQEFTFERKIVSWLTLKECLPADNKWCALSEFEAWGRDAAAPWSQVGDASLARELRNDPLAYKALLAMMGFQRQSWEQGTAGQALLECGEIDAAIALARASLVNVTKEGVVAASGGSTMDPLMLGETLLGAVHRTGDPQLQKAAEDMLQFALKGGARATDGTLFHIAEAKEVWSDETFTAAPLLAAAGYYDESIAQLRGIMRRLWDPRIKMMHHRWQENQGALLDSSHWGGGSGWTAAALMRLIRSLPADRAADRQQLVGTLKELLDGCLMYQRPDGLFHDEPNDPKTYVETNLAAMLGYTIYESVRGGWLPESYLPAADRMRAAVRAKVDRLGFVQGVAGAPRFDQPGISTEGQAFFLLLEASARKAGRPSLPGSKPD
ncbi:MAG: glycoside hydrolase family 88 protein [Opitutae bacterium]